MKRIRTIGDLDECRQLWEQHMPADLLSDLWEVRDCFHRHYRHKPRFVVAEEGGRTVGFLPLSFSEDTGLYNYFPGETWEGKTWLEQNRIIADSRRTLEAMLESLDAPHQLRYLRSDRLWSRTEEQVDEVGYLFLPEDHGFDIERYYEAFSHKTAKKLKKELSRWDLRRVEWRIGEANDFEILAQMNLSRFGRQSYFHDERFLEGFRDLKELLHRRGWLRLVTVMVDGEPAAVDMGSLYKGMLTMLAGGTDENFPGIAKLINMHHMTFACEQRLDSVDFLCGDFNWKTLFHLTPVPLYVLEGEQARLTEQTVVRPAYVPAATDWHGLQGAANA